MLGKYLRINSVQMPNPNPGTWQQGLNPIEHEYYTENGTRKTIPTRLDRMSWSGEFNCTSMMKSTLEGYCKLARVTCLINGDSFDGTLRLSSPSRLVENTELVEGTDGLWTVSLVFESF